MQGIKLLESNNIKKKRTKTTKKILKLIKLDKSKKKQTNDKNINNVKSNIKPKIKNIDEENNNMKEIENIMYDNYTEPNSKIKYNFKELLIQLI